MCGARRKTTVALLGILLAASGAPAVRAGQQAPSSTAAPVPVFEFHSGFWINLHHFLYAQARAPKGPAPDSSRTAAEDAASRSPAPRPISLDALNAKEREDWNAAVDYYAQDLAGRDLLFNGDMVNINNRLAELETCADLSGRSMPQCASGLRPELIATLERAAPVYRARVWPEHDRANRIWLSAAAPMARQMGLDLAHQLAAAYRADWPTEKLRVDLVIFGGPFGAYTTLDPVHLTISSTDPRNQGFAALEVLFHEASHALAGAVRDAIVRECRTRGKPIPRDLWHALLFYTTGDAVKRALSHDQLAAGQAAYRPYAYRFGLYARGWSSYQRVLERFWQPYLDGKTDFDSAVARIVSAL